MDNKEQLLKDYVATAQARNYDWEVVNSKFPEIDDLIKSMGLPSSVAKPKIEQLLKDYVATAEKREYDWALVNSKFPEFFPELKKKEGGLPAAAAQTTDTGVPLLLARPSDSSTEDVLEIPIIGYSVSSEVPLAEKNANKFAESIQGSFGFLEAEAKREEYNDEKNNFYSKHPDQAVRDAWKKVKSGDRSEDLQKVLDGASAYPAVAAYVDTEEKGKRASDPKVREAYKELQNLTFFGEPRMWSAEAKRAAELRKIIDESVYNAPRQKVDGTQFGALDYKEYDFGDATPFVNDVNSSIQKELNSFMNARMPEYISEMAPSRKKELEKEIKSLEKELEDNKDKELESYSPQLGKQETAWGKKYEEIQNRLRLIRNQSGGISEDYLLNSFYTELYDSEFVPEYRKAVLKSIPESKRRDSEFLEYLEDKLYYESGVNLNLDGNSRHNNKPWLSQFGWGMATGFVAGAQVKSAIVSIAEDLGLVSAETEMEYQREAEEVSALVGFSQTQYDYSAFDSFSRGDFGNGSLQILQGIGQAVPQVTSTAALTAAGQPHVAAILWGSVGGLQTVSEMKSARDDYGALLYSDAEVYGTAAARAVIEYGADLVLGKFIIEPAFKGLKSGLSVTDILDPAFRNSYNGTYRQMLFQYGKGAVTRYGIDAGEGAISEYISGVLGDASQAMITGEDFNFYESLYNNIDDAIIGGAIGFGTSAVGELGGPNVRQRAFTAANSPFDLWYNNNISSIDKRLRELNKQYESAQTSKEMVEIRNTMDEVQAERQKLINQRGETIFSLAANDPKFMDELSSINVGLASAALKLKRAQGRNNSSEVDAYKKKIAELVVKKEQLINGGTVDNQKSRIETNRSLVNDSVSKIDQAIKLAQQDLDVLSDEDSEINQSGNEDLIDQHDRAKATARQRVQELTRKKDELFQAISDRDKTEQELKEAVDNGEDSETIANIKSVLRDQEKAIEDMTQVFGTGDSISDLYPDDSPVTGQQAVPVRDKAWDDNKKASLPSVLQSIEQLQEILDNGTWGMITAENPMRKKLSEEENARRNKEAEAWLRSKGYVPIPIFGKYENSESSFFVENLTPKHALEFAELFDQESVAHSSGMIYQNGDISPRQPGSSIGGDPTDLYSTTNIGGELVDFQIDYDIDTRLDKDGNKVERIDTSTKEGKIARIEQIVNDKSGKTHVVITTNPDGSINLPQELLGLSDSELKSLNDYIRGVQKSTGQQLTIVIGQKGQSLSSKMSDVLGDGWNGAYYDGKIFIDPDNFRGDKGARVLFEELIHSTYSTLLKNLDPDAKRKITTEFLGVIGKNKELVESFYGKALIYSLLAVDPGFAWNLDDIDGIKKKLAESPSGGVNVDLSSRLLSLFEMAIDGKPDVDTTAEILSKNPMLFDESITQVMSEALSNPGEYKGLSSNVKSILQRILNFFGLGSATPRLDDIKSAQDLINGIQTIAKGRAVKGGKKSSGESFSIAGLPPRLRSLNGFSKSQWLERRPGTEFMSVDALPDGPFEVSYSVETRIYGSDSEFTEVSKKFNSREHFINWWKKTNIIPDDQFSGPQNVFPLFGEDTRKKKSVFSLFTVDGKMIDTTKLEQMYLSGPKQAKGGFFIKGKGALQFAHNRALEDLKLAYEDGVMPKRYYYIHLGELKRQIDGLSKQGDEYVKNAEYWEVVDAIKGIHVRIIENAFSDIRQRGNESIQPRLDIERDGVKVKRTEKGYFPDFQTYKGWKEQLDEPSFSYAISKRGDYDGRVESKKAKIINDAKAIGVNIDPKNIDNQAKAIVAAEIISETYPDLTPEERAKRILLLDAKALKEDGIEWEINKQFTEEMTRFIDNEFANRRIGSGGWNVIYTHIHAMTSNGQRESQNTAATITLFKAMVNHFEATGKLEIPEKLLKNKDVKGLISRFSNFESHVGNLNSYLNRVSDKGNLSFYNPKTRVINESALRAASIGEGSRKGKTQTQDVFGKTSDAAKLGAYQASLLGGLNAVVIDSHTIETSNIYTGGVKTPLTSTAINNALTKMQRLLDPPPATLSEGFNRLMEMKGKKGLDRRVRERICEVLNTLTQKNYDKNKKAIESYSEIIKYISENTSEAEAAEFGFDIYDATGKLKPEYTGSEGQFRIPEFYVHQVMFTQNQVRKTGKTTSPGSELKLYNDGDKKALDVYVPESQSALAAEDIREMAKEGVIHSGEFERFSIKPNLTTKVYEGASFSSDPEKLKSLRGLNGSISESLSIINGKSKRIKKGEMIDGLVPVVWNPFSQNKPQTEEGGVFVESADMIVKHGDKYYVSGNIKLADEAASRNTPSEKIKNLTKKQERTVEKALKPIAKRLDTSVETVFQNLNKETREAVLRGDQSVLEGVSYSVAGRVIRRTAAKAAAKFPGVKQEILNNPENYITPQNLQAVKDRLESLSEAELFDLMRDDVLGRLQNRNDDTGALAGAELIKRAIDRGDMDSVPELIEDLAKIGTSAGRILRHFRELKLQDPVRSTMSFIEAEVKRAGNTLTDPQKQKMNDILDRMFKNRDEYNDLVRRSQNGENLEAELKKAATDMANIEKELSTFANSVIERGWGDISKMLIQGNLLAPISHATNIGSNLINLIGNTFVDGIAIPIERLAGMLGMQLEYKRSYSFMAHLHAWKGFAMGTAEAMNTMFTGKNYDTSSEWSMQRGFMPLQSLLSAMSKEDLPLNEKGVPSISQRMKLWVQATLGTPAEINFRLLALGDIPFKRYAEQKELYRVGVSKGLKGEALAKFMKNPDKKSADIARREGRKLTFQQETTASEFTNQAVRSIENVIGTGLGYVVGNKPIDPQQAARFIMATAVPYRTTPANLLHETLTYVAPPYAISRIAAGIRRKDARAVSENFGKMVVGSALTVTAAMLIKEGLMSAPLDWEEDEEKNIAYDQFPPGSINISGLKRLINGEDPSKQPDDYFVSYEKLGIPGAVMGAVSKGVTKEELNSIEYDEMNFPHKMFLTAVGINPAAGISHMMDQSFMQGMQTLVSTMAASAGSDDFNRSLERWVSSFFKASTAVVLPNTLSALNRANREYMPDMRVTKDMSASERILKQLEYVIKDRTFNTSEIPVRVDWKGNPVKQTPEGASSIAYQLFDITKARQAESDPVSNEIYRLWDATGMLTDAVGTPGYAQKRSFTPPKPGGLSKKEQRAINKLPRKYTFLDDAEFLDSKLFLNTTELNSLMELSGKHRYNKIQELMKSDEYKKMSDEDRVEAINKIDKKYINKIEMDGNDLMPHSKAILDYMQDEYEQFKED